MTGGGGNHGGGRMPPPAEPHRIASKGKGGGGKGGGGGVVTSPAQAMAAFLPTPHPWLGRRLRICKVSEHGQRRYLNASIVFHDPTESHPFHALCDDGRGCPLPIPLHFFFFFSISSRARVSENALHTDEA